MSRHTANDTPPHPGEALTAGPVFRFNWFRRFAESAARAIGSPWAFMIALAVVALWGLSGPLFHNSQKWQMVINTSTTIVTLLMVSLLQGTQMRDTKALHLKLDELLRAVNEARTGLVGLERLPDERLQELADEFTELGAQERVAEQAAASVAEEAAAASVAEEAAAAPVTEEPAATPVAEEPAAPPVAGEPATS